MRAALLIGFVYAAAVQATQLYDRNLAYSSPFLGYREVFHRYSSPFLTLTVVFRSSRMIPRKSKLGMSSLLRGRLSTEQNSRTSTIRHFTAATSVM